MGVLKSRCSTWILDVARSLPPTATLNGFDIDLSQCPSKSWLPGNVSMLILDALDELPLDLIAQFDLVHVRLYMFVVSDPVPLLANVIKLLSESKPAPTLNLSTELPKSYPCMILWPAKCSCSVMLAPILPGKHECSPVPVNYPMLRPLQLREDRQKDCPLGS